MSQDAPSRDTHLNTLRRVRVSLERLLPNLEKLSPEEKAQMPFVEEAVQLERVSQEFRAIAWPGRNCA